jgi:hypothetical protein
MFCPSGSGVYLFPQAAAYALRAVIQILPLGQNSASKKSAKKINNL